MKDYYIHSYDDVALSHQVPVVQADCADFNIHDMHV
jgi:hypothetical protein